MITMKIPYATSNAQAGDSTKHTKHMQKAETAQSHIPKLSMKYRKSQTQTIPKVPMAVKVDHACKTKIILDSHQSHCRSFELEEQTIVDFGLVDHDHNHRH